jgi:hypothetical protein
MKKIVFMFLFIFVFPVFAGDNVELQTEKQIILASDNYGCKSSCKTSFDACKSGCRMLHKNSDDLLAQGCMDVCIQDYDRCIDRCYNK